MFSPNTEWNLERRAKGLTTSLYRGPFHIFYFSIYTLSDLGDLSNLIGSLSRTIQQYSPPSKWIMCELGFFPIFLENDLLKVDKILGLTVLGKKRLRRIQNGFFPFTVTEFCGRWIVCNSRLFA